MSEDSKTIKKRVLAFPVNAPFLKVLKQVITRDTGSQPGRAVVIFPTHRPVRYFYNLYKEEGKSVLLPRVLAYGELPGLWISSVSGNPIMANQLDQVFLAWEAVNRTAKDDEKLASRFARMKMDEFLPWGKRLARLFEELFANGQSPENIAHVDDSVAPIAADLLASLGTIGKNWVRALQERDWITPGYEAFLANERKKEIPALLCPNPNNHVYIAGFSFPNAVQFNLFQSLWENGAAICVSEPDGLFESEISYYCANQKSWISKLPAKVEKIGFSENEPETIISFFAGYDLHSQLEEIREILAKGAASSTAIVLPNTDALLPLLHILPAKDVNIAMGYPLSKTHFLNFLAVLFKMLENRNKKGQFYWQDVSLLLGQQFLGNLSLPDARETLEPSLRALRQEIGKQGNVYMDLLEFLTKKTGEDQNSVFLGELLEIVPRAFLDITTTAQLGDSLDRLVDFILQKFPSIWGDYKLDAEAIVRVQTQIIPVLKNNALANTPLDFKNLVAVFDGLAERESVPFEAFPIVGLQILGFNDMELLSFDNIIMPDVCEDLLPGSVSPDPLLPEDLRATLKLPDWRVRDEKAGYNFYRIIAPAEKAYILWQEGGVKSELFDNKKIKSRFAEQLIWKFEQSKKKLLKDWQDGFKLAKASLSLEPRQESCLELGSVLRKRLDEFIKQGFNASLLNQFFKCPLAFGYKNLLELSGVQDVNEGDDPALIGQLVHQIMQELYRPHMNKDLAGADFDRSGELQKIIGKLNEKNGANDLSKKLEKLPLASRLMLKAALEKRLGMFLANEQESLKNKSLNTKIRKLEEEFTPEMKFARENIPCVVKMDRIDERDGKYYILDYKTGSGFRENNAFWNNEELFSKLQDYCLDPANADGDELQQELYKQLRSIQLPFYMASIPEICAMGKLEKKDIGGAAYIDFFDSCMEKPLCDFASLDIDNIMEKCQIILDFLYCRMKNAKKLVGSGNGCDYCEYALICNAR